MKLIKLLLLLLIFAGGVYIGNIYLPQKDASAASAISMPDLKTFGTDINQFTLEKTHETIKAVEAALNASPNVDKETAKSLVNSLETTLLLQAYQIRKYRYQAEIAKNNNGSPTTSEYSKAAADYNSSKKTLEKYFEDQKDARDASQASIAAEESQKEAEQAAAPANGTTQGK
ncbi:hypothetical protein Emin_1148 [Elusimicrobium minutum Pei191]|uniref:Uncharacterized protein n=1 Tax=Elusimicrobium minutum (strain Pei191) TaxID=445932 RepID=B2KDV4_ELUMP|nr:hypothetical protein [Elusimicrobium minutum]ACC98700.1 hypothetical protein Emin_1148 [Elusimicrobium minutum Pei191]